MLYVKNTIASTGILVFIFLVFALIVWGAFHPEDAIKHRDNQCTTGCKSSHNPDLCYQACMYRE